MAYIVVVRVEPAPDDAVVMPSAGVRGLVPEKLACETWSRLGNGRRSSLGVWLSGGALPDDRMSQASHCEPQGTARATSPWCFSALSGTCW